MTISRESMVTDSVLNRLIDGLLEDKRRQEGLTPKEWDELRPRAEVYRDMALAGLSFRMVWGRASIHDNIRQVTCRFDDTSCEAIGEVMNNVKLKGELFLLRLIKHLPKGAKDAVDRIECGPEARLRVWFKNGQTLETTEAEIESDDFWATCGMVYDL